MQKRLMILVVLFVTITSAMAQREISGTVTAEGEPLPGVTVFVKGTTIGTVTDVEGDYSLSVPDEATTLVFSFIGMKSQEVEIGNQSNIVVNLESDVIGLEEVIAIGYGTMRKSDLTGSVVRVDMEDRPPQANLNIIQALQGASAGVNIQANGGAGSEPDLSIRGQTSLSATDRPLIVIDGIIYNGGINDINVNDVQTIDILKDASAAAVYGSRSANGVMLITTKKGKSGKPTINFNAYYGFQGMTNNPMKVMDGEQYAIRLVDYYYQQDLYQWYYTNPTSDAGKPVRPDVTNRNLVAERLRTLEEQENYLKGPEYAIDWVDEVLQVAPIQNYSLSYSGSGERTNYFVSGSYTDEEGILINDDFSRLTLHANIESEITDWLTVGVISSYSYRDYSGRPASLNFARRGTPWADNHIGSPDYDMFMTGEVYMEYPLVDTYVDNSDIRNNLFIVTNAKVKIPWIEGLSYNFDYSNTYNNRNIFDFYPVSHPDGAGNNGRADKDHRETRNWLINNILSYENTFGDHQVNATLLYSTEERNYNRSWLRSEKFENPVLGYNNMALGTIPSVSSEAWKEQSLAYMARANYTYQNRYMITGTIRRDGYSGFGAENKIATFPSLSVGWVASEESFMGDTDLYLKIRTSYGLNGNQGIGRYSSFSRMADEATVFDGSTYIGVYPNTLGNSGLSWESTASFNLGFDFGFLEQKISGSLDLYQAKTSDVLVERALPITTGFTNVWTNIGGIENKGIEFQLNTINVQRQDLNWTSNFIFSLNRDKITKLYGGENDMDIGNSWFVGEPISAIYDLEIDGGIWTEEELYSGAIFDNWYPGQYRYKDLNSDAAIDQTNDRKIIGYGAPAYRFSINNVVSYKNFTLSFFINSVQGGDKYYLQENSSVVNIDWNADNVYRINASAVRPYWTPDNGVNNATGVYNTPVTHGGVYESRSFVRLQDISLSYQLGKKSLDYLNLQDLRVYIASKNAYTWTNWSGWDPESGTSNNPVMRNITLGIKLTL